MESEKIPPLSQRLLAEFIGTFFLVFAGAGSSVAVSYANPSISLIVAALANGLALALAVSATMNISGGHINPAVTIAVLIARKIKGSNAIMYIISQLLGSILASYLLVASMPNSYAKLVNYGAPTLSSQITVAQGILLEAIMTFLLVFVVFGTAIDKRGPKIGGFGIGLAVTANALVGGPFTGAAMNPARALGPEIASMYFSYWYIYWIGPIIGGIIASLIYGFIMLKNKQR